MKKALVLIFTLVLVQLHFPVHSQTWVWKTPEPLTDSLSNNQNPFIAYIDFFDDLGYYVFWERSEDSLSTDIYVKNFYTADDPQPIVGDGNYHYTNPQVIAITDYYPPDTMFYLLYESDSSGNTDIYAVKVSASTISDPVAVSNDTAADSHMRCNNSGSIVWESNGQILYARIEDRNTPDWYVSDPVVVSGPNSYNPAINCKYGDYGYEYIVWENHTDTNAAVYYCKRVYSDSAWSAPIMLYNTGYSMNLRFNNDFWWMGIPLLTWDNEYDGLISPKAYDFDSQDFHIFDMYQNIPFTPCILPIIIPVADFWQESFYAFTYLEDGSRDIFVSESPWFGPTIDYFINLTETWQAEQNPQIFQGREQSYYQDFILVWESERSDNWQLWSSIYTMPMGGIGEGSSSVLPVKTLPNPFKTSATFLYTLSEPSAVEISIFNSRGQPIENMELKQSTGEQQVQWNAEGLPAGMYYYRIQAGDMVGTGKLLKINY